MQTYLQGIIEPALQFLQRAVTALNDLSLTARRGLDLSQYLGPLGVLGPGFRALVVTVVTAAVVVIVTSLALGMYRLYLAFKEGVKWW